MENIYNLLFQSIENLTIKCGGNIAGHLYINYFQNKNTMTVEQVKSFKRDVEQEILSVRYADRDNRKILQDSQIHARNQLKQLLSPY